MMTNLFSVFDPLSSILHLPLNWLSTFLAFFIIPFLYWAMPSRFLLLWSTIISTLHKEFKLLLGPLSYNGSIIFISLFSLILFNNFLGLLPYIFTSSSHMALTLSFALPLWVSFMLYGWLKNTQHMFSHLVPQGTPTLLMPFMVLIETISNIIRPGTLAVRLAANMIAGHLLLTLLGNTGHSLSSSLLFLLLFAQILLLTLESAVAIIQSYVFAILTSLYASEVN
uniref:ATP synthase F0 subunit 6 n=1 Tax=Allanaspides hickmani TaxID=91998 RepID=UPI002A81E985|nr:ATP synthase F0 subunit 6 [Allanaspides hickmani]WOR80970.1 ATP synthase F0 subunit 6 [Allanaspides hickmani]WOR80983.1 ATP synthase F0 subunit 6 [Allanaspides hickmani]